MKKILIMNNDPELVEIIQKEAPGWTVVSGDQNTPEEELYDAEIVAGWGRVVAKICTKSNDLKWLQSWSAGVDAYPLAELKERGVYITNASGVHAYPISETIIAMMLSFARGLRSLIPKQMSREWGFAAQAWEIHGQTAGILGAGAIGLETARILKAFGMKTLGLRRSGEDAECIDVMYKQSQLHELLGQCDFVINILPHTPETRGIMNAEAFANMKSTACYISVGRGPTTDQDALIEALRNKTIAFAGLDVTNPEPLPADSPLWEMENVIITPHSAGATQFYSDRALDIFLENLRSYLKSGKPSRNLINPDEGY